jgi:hypothetical protein
LTLGRSAILAFALDSAGLGAGAGLASIFPSAFGANFFFVIASPRRLKAWHRCSVAACRGSSLKALGKHLAQAVQVGLARTYAWR